MKTISYNLQYLECEPHLRDKQWIKESDWPTSGKDLPPGVSFSSLCLSLMLGTVVSELIQLILEVMTINIQHNQIKNSTRCNRRGVNSVSGLILQREE